MVGLNYNVATLTVYSWEEGTHRVGVATLAHEYLFSLYVTTFHDLFDSFCIRHDFHSSRLTNFTILASKGRGNATEHETHDYDITNLAYM
jgi:hypothetical protein